VVSRPQSTITLNLQCVCPVYRIAYYNDPITQKAMVCEYSITLASTQCGVTADESASTIAPLKTHEDKTQGTHAAHHRCGKSTALVCARSAHALAQPILSLSPHKLSLDPARSLAPFSHSAHMFYRAQAHSTPALARSDRNRSTHAGPTNA
jgi:hypothetical protein